MIKYFCDHCGEETDNNYEIKDFKIKGSHVCGSCWGKLQELQREHDENIENFRKKEDQKIKDFLNIV